MKSIAVLVVAAALLAPAAPSQAAVRATVKFSPRLPEPQRVSAVRTAGGRVLAVRGTRVIARMPARAAARMRTAMGVLWVRF